MRTYRDIDEVVRGHREFEERHGLSRDTEMPATPPAVPARRRPEIEDEDIEEYKNLSSALVAEQKKELTAMERLLKREGYSLCK